MYLHATFVGKTNYRIKRGSKFMAIFARNSDFVLLASSATSFACNIILLPVYVH
jgi:hypothetical protein